MSGRSGRNPKIPTISKDSHIVTERPEDYNPQGEDYLDGDNLYEGDELPEGQADDQDKAAAIKEEENHWLSLAQSSYDESTDHMQSGLFARFERSYDLANSKHPAGSKYHTVNYKHRSKVFRGKTQASIRKNEAAAAVALFSTKDVVTVDAANKGSKEDANIASGIHKVANYHLTNGFDWFLDCIGAYHEAQSIGVVFSKQYWDYEVSETGKKIKDKPAVDLLPIENIRMSPNANWKDPVNSSPYFIIITPTFVGDVMEKIDAGEWREYTPGQLISSASDLLESDTVKRSRINKREDVPRETDNAEDEFNIVQIHENFIRYRGQEFVYYTAGTTLLLSDPELLSEAYPHVINNNRPIRCGRTSVEPHNVFCTSLPERVEGAQIAANEIANQRKDNVELAMNKRTFAMRKSGVDFHTLMRNIPGSTILMDHLDAIKQEDVRDVTSSSYQEQHMINADFDEQAGSFSNSSVSTNRQMNDSVGGMNLMKGDSNTMTEYQLRIFVETWVEPVSGDITEMVKFYEDDDVIQRITGDETLNHEAFANTDIMPQVSAGFGATDPQQKIQKLMLGLKTMFEIKPEYMQQLDGVEIGKEIFGALGYNDGSRFINEMEEGDEDPRIAELEQMVQQLKQMIEQDVHKIQAKTQAETAGKVEVEKIKQIGAIEGKKIDASVSRSELILTLQNERQNIVFKVAAERQTTVDKLMQDSGMATAKSQIDLMGKINDRFKIKQQAKELNFKMTTGKDGI